MSVHRELIHGVFLQIFQNSSVICLSDQLVSGLLCLCLTLMLAGAADTAPCADHALDKVLRQTAYLHEKKRLFTLGSSVAAKYLCVKVFFSLLHTLYNSRRYASAVSKTLSEYRAFLILVGCGLQLYTLGGIMARISPKVIT